MKQSKPRFRVRTLLVATIAVAVLASCGNSPEKLVSSAKDYIAKGDYNAAVIQLRAALQKAPDNGEARYLLGTALNSSREPAAAEKELRKAMELGYPSDKTLPALGRALVDQGHAAQLISEFADSSIESADGQADFKIIVGDAALQLGKKREAEVAFNAALVARPASPLAQVGIATLRAGEGNTEAAQKIVDEILTKQPPVPEALILKADLLVRQGQPDAAQRVLEQAVQAKPDFLVARYGIVSLLIGKRDYDNATAQIAEIRKIGKADARAYFFEALIANQRGQFPAARDAVQQVLKVSPDNLQSLLLAGEIEFRTNQFNQAQDYLRRALHIAPTLVYAQRLLAVSYLRTGNPTRALEVLQPALNRGVKDPQLLAVAGEAYLANGDYAKAAQFFEQTASLDAKNVGVRTRLGEIRFAEGDSSGAIRELEAASALNSNESTADLALIANFVRRKELDQALAAVNRLEKKQPDSPLVYNLKGVVYMTKRDFASARKSFERATELQPNFFPAVFNLTRLDVAENKPDQAQKRLQALLDKEPQNDQAMLALAALLQNRGIESAKVEALLKQAVVANSASIGTHATLVNYYVGRRDGKQALLAAQNAMVAVPNDPRTLELLGQVQQATGELSQALESFTKLITMQPGTVGPLMHVASIQAATREYDKSIDTLRSVLAINPAYFDARRDIAAVYAMSGRPELALREVKALQRAQPTEMAGYLIEGDLWASQGKWADAEAAYKSAQKYAPNNEIVVMRLHASMATGGRSAEANAMIDKWLHDHPKDFIVNSYLGEREIKNKDYRAAAKRFQAALAQQPDNPVVLNNLAWASGKVDDPKALDYAQKASSLAPASAEIMDTLGTLLVKKGDVPAGVGALQKATQLAGNLPEIRLDLARALITAGNKDAARKELELLVAAHDTAPPRPAPGTQEPTAPLALAGTAPPLTCNAECAAQATALLKTL